jgi:hypothetical protein
MPQPQTFQSPWRVQLPKFWQGSVTKTSSSVIQHHALAQRLENLGYPEVQTA